MKTYKAWNFSELHRILSTSHFEKRARKWIFRGQIDRTDWKLIPKAGRVKLRIPDENLFRAWKRHAYAYENRFFDSDWEWLYIAQHHGLATRLLDWTTNPLAAAFFAIRQLQIELGETLNVPQKEDISIWAYRDERAWGAGKKDYPKQEPFERLENSNGEKKFVQRVVPRSVTQRLVRQQGIFTYHDPPDYSLEEDLSPGRILEKIIVDKACLLDLQSHLSFYGLNEWLLFPDFDGLSRHLNWDYRS